MEALPEVLEELRVLAGRGFLSQQQVDIVMARRDGASYDDIERRFGLSGPTALIHCLLRTACGYFWKSSMKGGTDNYLGPGDEEKFTDYVVAACDAVNCITTSVAISLACVMKRDRLSRAKELLMLIDCEKLMNHLREPMPPSRSWLNGVCERLGVRLCRGQELEMARRLWCDRDTIIQWFTHFSLLFERPLELMFNMDETFISSSKTLHCVAPVYRSALTCSLPVVPHMTGAITIHGGGERVRPLLILPKKKTIRSLEQFTRQVYLASSTSGWMTKTIFRYYALTFAAELSVLRLRWPDHLKNEPVLLFLDGHQSRWDFRANFIFWIFNVDVLSFPGHCSHVLQMFDVGIASPLKAELKKELASSGFSKFMETLDPADFTTQRKRTTHEMRSLLIESFITAYEKVCTTKNCRSSFRATGVYPYNPDRVLSNDFTMDPPREGLFPRRPGKASAKYLTSDESLAEMFIEENGRPPTPDDLKADLASIWEDLRASGLDRGMPLTDAPDILMEGDMSRIYRLCRVAELRS